MKNQPYLNEQSILNLITQNNFLIPEIQREYVWGNNELVINRFLNEIKNKAGKICTDCRMPKSPEIFNIGFLYSYKPDYVKVEYERFLDEYLIDGQQRFTTIFLLLFYCSLKENRKHDFLNLIRYEKLIRMGFDYRVRDLTHRFLLEFIEKIRIVEELNNIEEQTWFLKDYNNDVTIKSILQAIKIIYREFNSDDKYYDYILNYIKFWHFKTEATSQGEELYITMNARGEALSENEITKAGLMINNNDLTKWGKKWEEWQDFFWKNRAQNPNSDLGFNEFLRWVYLIEKCEKNNDDEENDNIESVKELKSYFQNPETNISNLNFEIIKKYFEAIKFLFEAQSEYIKKEWFAPSLSLDLKSYIILFPAIFYIKKIKGEGNNLDNRKLKRIIRYFFNLTRLSTVTKAPDIATISAIKAIKILFSSENDDIAELPDCKGNENISKTILPEEEKYKLKMYKNPPENISRDDLETLFWKAEDFNLNNGQIKFILKVIDFDISDTNDFDFNLFSQYSECFIELFNNPNDILRRALLTKGNYFFWDGHTYGLGDNRLDRYTFINSVDKWRKLINEHGVSLVIELIKSVSEIKEKDMNKTTKEVLQEVIDLFLEKTTTSEEWKYLFIKFKEPLAYCSQKNVCFNNNDTFLLSRVKVMNETSYITLKNLIDSISPNKNFSQ